MKKLIILFFTILLSLWLLVNITNAYKSFYVWELKNEKVIFKFSDKYLDKVNMLFWLWDYNNKKWPYFMNCYSNDGSKTKAFDFTCKKDWNGLSKDKAWCGFIKKENKDEYGYCLFGKNLKDWTQKTYYKFNVYTKGDYPFNFDITDKFYKKSIQKKALSCESSAASDIISTIKNKRITEDDVLAKLPHSHYWTTASWWKDGKRYWGDPEKWFVWYLDQYKWRDALQRKYEWYGVYEDPIRKVYSAYGIPTKKINKYNRNNYWLYTTKDQLVYSLKELVKWNYVQLWGDTCTYPQYEDWKLNSPHIEQYQADKGLNWRNLCDRRVLYKDRKMYWTYVDPTTKKTKNIVWLNWEHAYFLLWYKWNINNPTHIIVWDTNTWRHVYPVNEWIRKWDKMENRSIIVKG